MTASNELEAAINNTQEILSKIISKPKCTNKLLNKPPFRFIHDIVTSTLKATGFPDRYFSTQELDSNHFNNKSSKVAFLEKLIYLVSVAKGIPLDVRPAKIVAGLEVLNTNALLFAFGTVAIDQTVPKDRLIEYCKNGGKIGHMDKDQQILNVVLVEESKAGNRGRMVDDNKPQEITTSQKHINQDQLEEDKLDIPLTQTILHDLISKPKCTEKLLRKPPFRFIHDVVMAVNKASTIGLEKILR
jgi:Microtubule-binding protein MIP-T3.